VIKAADTLHAILQDGYPVLAGDLHDRIHIAWRSEQMDGNDDLGTRSDFSLEVLRIDIQCVVDIISMQSSRAVRYEDFKPE